MKPTTFFAMIHYSSKWVQTRLAVSPRLLLSFPRRREPMSLLSSFPRRREPMYFRNATGSPPARGRRHLALARLSLFHLTELQFDRCCPSKDRDRDAQLALVVVHILDRAVEV